MSLPPCGLYRTTVAIGEVEADRLVYFHNHGDPGPGVYLPESWEANRALFAEKGVTLPNEEIASTLAPLADEGLYRVVREFFCCENKCQRFEEDMLVQLGYDGDATPIVFVPELVNGHLAIPDEGAAVDDDAVQNLALLKVAWSDDDDVEQTVH